jgi:hypothetical protein
VRAKNAEDVWGSWSSVFSFLFTKTPIVTSSLPDGGTISDQTPLIVWDEINGQGGYDVEISNTSSFTGTPTESGLASA